MGPARVDRHRRGHPRHPEGHGRGAQVRADPELAEAVLSPAVGNAVEADRARVEHACRHLHRALQHLDPSGREAIAVVADPDLPVVVAPPTPEATGRVDRAGVTGSGSDPDGVVKTDDRQRHDAVVAAAGAETTREVHPPTAHLTVGEQRARMLGPRRDHRRGRDVEHPDGNFGRGGQAVTELAVGALSPTPRAAVCQHRTRVAPGRLGDVACSGG